MMGLPWVAGCMVVEGRLAPLGGVGPGTSSDGKPVELIDVGMLSGPGAPAGAFTFTGPCDGLVSADGGAGPAGLKS